LTGNPEYVLHPEAAEDIVDIWEYLAAESLEAVSRVREDIQKTISNLAFLPRLGHRREDLTSLPLRFVRVRDYLIAYAPEEEPICIIAVIHGHRNPRVMAAILRSREGLPE
jgi:toxin ParE1/3/4